MMLYINVFTACINLFWVLYRFTCSLQKFLFIHSSVFKQHLACFCSWYTFSLSRWVLAAWGWAVWTLELRNAGVALMLVTICYHAVILPCVHLVIPGICRGVYLSSVAGPQPLYRPLLYGRWPTLTSERVSLAVWIWKPSKNWPESNDRLQVLLLAPTQNTCMWIPAFSTNFCVTQFWISYCAILTLHFDGSNVANRGSCQAATHIFIFTPPQKQ